MTDSPSAPLNHEVRETKRGRWRSYLLDADGKMLMYSPASFTDPADADRLGEFVVNGNEDAWKAKLEAVKRTHLDDLAKLAAARRDLEWEKGINRWVLLSIAAAAVGSIAYTIVY